METLFILLHRHHHWPEQSNDNTSYIPLIVTIVTTVILFVLEYIINYFIKRGELVKKLENELIYASDKMLRNATNFEFMALESKHAHARYMVNKDDYDLKYTDYYHHEAEKHGKEYDLLKSDLKRCIKDISIYWGNEKEKKELIRLNSGLVFIRL